MQKGGTFQYFDNTLEKLQILVSGESVNKENGVLNYLNVMKYVFIAQRGVR